MSMVIIFIFVCISNGVVFGKHVEFESFNENIIDPYQQECTSQIYCLGQDTKTGEPTLLHDVQMNKIFNDGTTFVTKGLKFSEKEILEKYAKAKLESNWNLNITASLEEFVEKNFYNDVLLNATLADFNNTTEITKNLSEPFKNWLTHLNNLWVVLAKKLPENTSNFTSFIPVPNPFIIAGGRFTEMYYWDSYWIVKGLLVCKMNNTAREIIENMIHLVEKLGYIPNGNRIYYKGRSQPPMLIQMAKIYYDETKNETFIKKNLKTFEKEFEWWLDNRRVEVVEKGRRYYAFVYNAVSHLPRPESYREDFELLDGTEDRDEILKIYTGIRSGAESGWDFSSRHMREPDYCNEKDKGLKNMNPQEYAYVDLNSIIYSNVKILAEWKHHFGDKNDCDHYKKVKYYKEFAEKMLDFIENVLWNEKERIWLDYDLLNKKHRNFYFSSNLTPLWSKSYSKSSKVIDAIEYLKRNQIINENLTIHSTLNGIPSTGNEMENSKQQWDYSNLWAPLQSFVIRGLYDSRNKKAMRVATNLATAFVKTVYLTYLNESKDEYRMFEKYDAEKMGVKGGGGEYTCVAGFGWTNGFIFDLFSMCKSFPIFSNLTLDCGNDTHLII